MSSVVPAFAVEGKFGARPKSCAPTRRVIGHGSGKVTVRVSESQAAERLGRYQLLEPIGAGPNGSVWRAKVYGVAGFERQFAVKRIPPELAATPASAAALSAAARAYGSLEHPRIARMSEFGVAQGQTYTAVELVQGLDAMRLVADAKIGGTGLPAGGALALVSQIARAVGYAHGRGLTHLGLAPTNVLVTGDGDVKVTDFSILSATLPPHPGDDPRLANRVAYLAPEQLSGEAVSAATDVFALGVIAYELVTGHRAFTGDNAAAVVQGVLAGPPPEPQLPRPIVRVLQRCLARSPFERFPDARALADALDAALRVAPVPGTRKDIGAQVKATLERLAALNEGNLSGVLALNLGTAAPAEHGEVATTEFVRPDVPVSGPPPLVGPRAVSSPPSIPSIPKVTNTVPGLAPPPVPSATKKPSVPTIMPRNASKPPSVPPFIPPVAPRSATTQAGGAQTHSDDDAARTSPGMARTPSRAATDAPTTVAPDRSPTPEQLADVDSDQIMTMPESPPRDMQTHEMSPLLADKLADAARDDAPHRAEEAIQQHVELIAPPPSIDELLATVGEPPELRAPEPALVEQPPSSTMPGFAPPPRARSQPSTSQPDVPAPAFKPDLAQRRSGGGLKAFVALLVVAGLGAGGYVAYTQYLAPKSQGQGSAAAKVAETDHGSAQVKAPPPKGSDTPVASAGSAKGSDTEVASAGSAHTGSAAGSAQKTSTDTGEKPVATGTSDQLEITSTPAGARVFLDGADQGTTPVKIPGSSDRHNIALLMPGHDLYVAEVDGHGKFSIEMKAVTPSGGPAGIKVLKCKKDRYYVYVDDKPTGMLCPTERIHVKLGPHTVEVYDAVSESRQKFDINVPDDRLSVRVRLE
jgi:serine/threonine protein kinase